jgi:hypothetical protein
MKVKIKNSIIQFGFNKYGDDCCFVNRSGDILVKVFFRYVDVDKILFFINPFSDGFFHR